MGFYDVTTYASPTMSDWCNGMMAAGAKFGQDCLNAHAAMYQCLVAIRAQAEECTRQRMANLEASKANLAQTPLFNLPETNGTTTGISTTGTSYQTESAYVNPSFEGKTINRKNSDYGPAFLARVKEIAAKLNCDYKDLLAVMNSESGIRADAKNPNGSATGLIQFVESTARGLGTSTTALRNMSPLRQLDYVEKYLVGAKNRQFSSSHRLTAGELYALIFLPARASREVLTASGENFYAANRGLDKNKDGKITKTELSQQVINKRVSDNSFLA